MHTYGAKAGLSVYRDLSNKPTGWCVCFGGCRGQFRRMEEILALCLTVLHTDCTITDLFLIICYTHYHVHRGLQVGQGSESELVEMHQSCH